MKRIIYVTTFIMLSINVLAIDYNLFFDNKSLRVDLYHCGNYNSSNYFFKEFIIEPYYCGSKNSLIDKFNYGTNMVEVFDKETGTLIYSRGYCTLFEEWQDTDEAKISSRCFEESVSVPLPHKNAIIKIMERNSTGDFVEIFSIEYDPDNIFVTTERRAEYPVFDIMVNGDPENKVDIVIVPDGYTADQMDKFKEDCRKVADVFKQFEPYKSNISKFNIRAVLAPSMDSGTDVPRNNIFVRTVLDTHFDTFESDRYCTTSSFHKLKDVASNAPYDQIYILVNSDIYGGGGIYNYYSLSTSGNVSSAEVIIHEFGHAFAGLADEYYESQVSYGDYYRQNVEPWEPNITTLVNFDSKWKDKLSTDIPIPTPIKLKDKYPIGVYEGGGYVAKGVYRPSYECMMKSFVGNVFCDVCSETIVDMILFYSK